METTQRKAGRPEVPAERKKKNRAISLTDAEYYQLIRLADEMQCGPSAYLIKKLRLS